MIKKIAKGFLLLWMPCFALLTVLFGVGDYRFPDCVRCYREELPVEVFGFTVEPGEDPDQGTVMALGLVPVKRVTLEYYDKTRLIPGGDLFGVRLRTSGLLVTELGEVKTQEGVLLPGEQAGIKKGDLLLSANGEALESAGDLARIFEKSGGSAVEILLSREGKEKKVSLQPVLAADGGYRGGLWVRDGAAGMGTVTFIDPVTGNFGGLGHAICDGETGVIFPLLSGEICESTVDGIRKGQAGNPGELRGHLGNAGKGILLANTASGVFGRMQAVPQREALPIAKKHEVTTGEATIRCTLGAEGIREYRIRIEEILDPDRPTKNMILQITDPALLEQTGGIVQGMSGSPIIQNGKLIGAVTHVLVDDPTKGYGIFIENMLETAQSVANEQLKEAS